MFLADTRRLRPSVSLRFFKRFLVGKHSWEFLHSKVLQQIIDSQILKSKLILERFVSPFENLLIFHLYTQQI
ncbi:hypothetical protein LEP1GSC161_1904 [Leptospira santarosai str. CBC1416]|uniref:Uncharacterized protein n=1 Tax=Leptospira santarosai str. CBC1416 TaxID=1193059 RepID=M6VQP4_9LEPT|nr:hypothetical protein LEP1GSC161_1904 [Leptospira santarosai str. CBC1416]